MFKVRTGLNLSSSQLRQGGTGTDESAGVKAHEISWKRKCLVVRPGTAIPCLELGIAPAAQINCSYSSREPKERQSHQLFACFNKKPLVTAHMGGVYITFLLLLLGNTLHCVLLNLKKKTKKPPDLSIFSL